MGFLIDTCIWVDVERGTISPQEVAAVTLTEPVFLSPITIAELKFGAENAPSEAFRQQRLAALARLQQKPVLFLDAGSGEIFGGLAALLHKSGRHHRHRIQDLWLASQAIQHSLHFLTHNRKDFADIPGLLLAVWGDLAA